MAQILTRTEDLGDDPEHPLEVEPWKRGHAPTVHQGKGAINNNNGRHGDPRTPGAPAAEDATGTRGAPSTTCHVDPAQACGNSGSAKVEHRQHFLRRHPVLLPNRFQN